MPITGETLAFKGWRFDKRSGALLRQGTAGKWTPVPIGSRAGEILALLLEKPGALVSKDAIMDAVWPDVTVEPNNLTVQIAALRAILDEGHSGESCIRTVPGRGYRFVSPITRVGGAEAEPAPRPANDPIAVQGPETPSLSIAKAPGLSLVVLPFANLGDGPDQQYFADAVTEDLTTDLSRISGMLVISRNTAFTYRSQTIDTKQIGRELRVRYVLEGSVRRSGTRVRVTAQLIDTDPDAHLWAERFDKEFGDLLDLQNEITGRLANTLKLELLEAEASRPADHSSVFDCILRGRAALTGLISADNYAEAIGLYERALVLNPQSVDACGSLAVALASRNLDRMTNSAAADMERAERLIRQALAASPRNPSAHLARGLLFDAQSRFEEAIEEYETALRSNRNWAAVIALLGKCKLLTGFLDEAVLLQERAILLSPRDPYIGLFYFRIGVARLLQSHIGKAITWLEKARLANEEHPVPHAWLAAAYALEGATERGVAELAKARALTRDDRYSSISRLKAMGHRAPKVRELIEATFIAGLRLAGMPEGAN